MSKLFSGAAALLVVTLAACGGPTRVGRPITITDGWAAPSTNGARTAAGYLTITNSASEDDHLIAASSTRASQVMIHETAMEGAMSTMHSVAHGLAIPAGKRTALGPGAGHLMFIDITAPFIAGDTIPVRLTFQKAGVVSTTLPVRPR